MGDDGSSEHRTASLYSSRGGAQRVHAYVLVVEQGTSSVVPLPDRGILTIGRAAEADLRLDHASVSRIHARLVVDAHQLRITDLDSHNGTKVNGQPVRGGRVLTTGDVVAIGEIILVIHGQLESELAPVILDGPSWHRRLGEELDRSGAYGRPFSVFSIASASSDVSGALRTIDVLGRSDDHEVLALLPEVDAGAARALATTLSSTLTASAPQARIGIATFPVDANDAENLLMAARSAARVAVAGGVASANEAASTIRLGERSVVVCHPSMVRVFDLLARLASSELPVLIIGETGVGKENAAFAVHHHSPRMAGPFVALNCATLHESLVESQLFGHDKGAFTGAVSARTGVFEAATGGTLFLDEIGELPLAMQAKLLRVLETKRVTRVGETRERDVDVRIVAATNRVLEHEVEAGRFRQDLYFRLGAARVHLPPLRDRRCDIPILFRQFLADGAAKQSREVPVPSAAVMQALLAHAWPGNVRELKHAADYALATSDDKCIELEDLPPTQGAAPPDPSPETAPEAPMRKIADELADIERQRMREALVKTHGVKRHAAAMIGMPIRTFNMKVKQYGL